MEIISTIWQIIWILLLTAVAAGSLTLLIVMFHPLRFDVKLRGSPKGQRAEVWFVYLFRMFRIGIIATPRTQDIVISFLGRKKRLERMGRKASAGRPPAAPPAAPASYAGPTATTSSAVTDDAGRTAGDTSQTAEVQGSSAVDSTVETSAKSQPLEIPDEQGCERPESSVADSDAPPVMKPADTTHPAAEVETSTGATAKAEPAIEDAETVEPVVSEAPASTPGIDSRPLKPLHEVEADYQAAKDRSEVGEQAGKESAKEGASLRQLLRKFKRDATRRFSQIKSYLRLFRRKWRLLSPVMKRFWQRGKKAFGLPRTDLLLRYALHEPYLTGMSHATLAVASGMAGQWGINFMPVPHFGAPMVYSRASISAVIKPWRLLFATCALLFEKQLYVESWQLFKWYRSKKQQ